MKKILNKLPIVILITTLAITIYLVCASIELHLNEKDRELQKEYDEQVLQFFPFFFSNTEYTSSDETICFVPSLGRLPSFGQIDTNDGTIDVYIAWDWFYGNVISDNSNIREVISYIYFYPKEQYGSTDVWPYVDGSPLLVLQCEYFDGYFTANTIESTLNNVSKTYVFNRTDDNVAVPMPR